MAAVETVEILFSDLEDVRQVLAACAGFFYAEDLQRAQIAFAAVTKSPLTKEIEIVQTRCDGYLGDYLREKYESEQLEEEIDDEEETETEEETVEEVEEEEELSAMPLGSPKTSKQRGRRVTKEELLERAAKEEEGD